MQRHNHKDSFVIRVLETNVDNNNNINNSTVSPKLNLSTMKIFNRFRKLLMRLIFSLPSSTRSSSASASGSAMQRNSDRFEPPKTSCSSYYSSHSHYNEAIADCIEFFNKSSQDHAIFDDEARRKSDVMV